MGLALLNMCTNSSRCDRYSVTVFTCPFTLGLLCPLCMYVRSNRSLTSLKWAPFHHLADFPQCDRWSSNLLVDYREKRKKTLHESLGKKDNLLHTSKAVILPICFFISFHLQQIWSKCIYLAVWVKICKRLLILWNQGVSKSKLFLVVYWQILCLLLDIYRKRKIANWIF